MSRFIRKPIKQSVEIYNILSHNDHQLNSVVNDEVIFPLSQNVEDQIDKLIDTLRYNKGVYEKKGVAIAANQVGLNLRFFCMADYFASPKNIQKRIEIICNPKVIDQSKETDIDDEGCLSIPELIAYVTRPQHILVEYQNILGKQIKKELQGFQARIFLHELDHLNGIHMLKIASKVEVNPLFTEYTNKLQQQQTEQNKLLDHSLHQSNTLQS